MGNEDKDNHSGKGAPPQEQPKSSQDKAPEQKEEHHHHGKNIAKRAGHSVVFGAGATVGRDIVQSVIN